MARQKTTQINKPKKTSSFQFQVGDEVIYLGYLYDEYRNKKCIVISRSRNRNRIHEYYKLQFEDNFIMETIENAIRKEEGNID